MGMATRLIKRGPRQNFFLQGLWLQKRIQMKQNVCSQEEELVEGGGMHLANSQGLAGPSEIHLSRSPIAVFALKQERGTELMAGQRMFES